MDELPSVDPSRSDPAPPVGVVEIDFPAGARLRITGSVDPGVVTAAVAALSGRPA